MFRDRSISYIISCDIAIHLRSRLQRYRHGNITDTIEIGYSCSLNRTISEKSGYHWYPYSWIALALITRSVWLEKKITRKRIAYMPQVIRAWCMDTQNLSSMNIEIENSFGNDGAFSYLWFKSILFYASIIFLILQILCKMYISYIKLIGNVVHENIINFNRNFWFILVRKNLGSWILMNFGNFFSIDI